MKNLPNPKLATIVESIQAGQIQTALREITSVMSKPKFKEKLTSEQLEMLNLLRGLCLAKVGQLGEAKHIFMEFTESHKNFDGDSDLTLWISNIAAHFDLTKELRVLLDSYFAKNEKEEKITMERFHLLLKEKNFAEAQSQAIKIYKNFNKPNFLLFSVYFQYLDKLKDPKTVKDQLKLPMMFLDKFIKGQKFEERISASKIERIDQQAAKLLIEMLLKQEKDEDAYQELVKYHKLMDDKDFTIQTLSDIFTKTSSDKVLHTLTSHVFALFNENNDLNKFRYSYEVFKHFLNLVLSRIEEDKFTALAEEILKDTEFKGSEFGFGEEFKTPEPKEILHCFWYGLASSKKMVSEKFSNNANLKNSYKTIITLQLDFCAAAISKVPKLAGGFSELALKFVKEYCDHFRLTFALAEEVYPYVAVLQKTQREELYTHLESLFVKETSINRCLTDINNHKLKWAFDFGELTQENVEKTTKALISKFAEHMKQYYADYKGVEKGERLLNDDYLLLAADILIAFIHSHDVEKIDEKFFDLYSLTIYILELGIAISPYNHDMKLRAMYLYGQIGAPDRAQDIYKTMDIKAIQLDTLGYVFFTPFSQLSLEDRLLDLCRDGIKYHIENMRESKESIISCVKNDNLEKLPQFVEWERLIASSWFKAHLELIHLENEVRGNIKKDQETSNLVSPANFEIDYYGDLLDKVVDRFLRNPKELSMNFDMLVCQPLMVTASIKAKHPLQHNFSFNTFLGVFDSQQMFIARLARTYLLDLLCRDNSESFCKLIEKQLDNLQSATKNLEKVDFGQFHIHNRHEALLKPNSFDKLNSSLITKLFEFERKALEIEHSLFMALHRWQVFDAANPNLYEDLVSHLKTLNSNLKLLQADLQELLSKQDEVLTPRAFFLELKNAGRFIGRLTETFWIVGTRLSNVKSSVNKALKKVKDDELKKNYTNLLKEYTNIFKSEDSVLLILDKLFSRFGLLVKGFKENGLKSFEKLNENPLAQLVLEGKIVRSEETLNNLKDGIRRNYVFILGILEDKIKERIKSVKQLSA